jgi:hypothetical protein
MSTPSMPSLAAPEPGRHDPPARAGAVDLALIMARQTPVAWFESVAIVQELCARLLAGVPGSPLAVPDSRDIVITAEGGVDFLREGPRAEPAVMRAAGLVLALVKDAVALPIPLRLLVLQEVSPSPACRTLSELTVRLAAFERPGRSGTIREVYDRFHALTPVQESASATPASTGRTAASPRVRQRFRRRRALVVTAALLLAVVIAGAWLWPRLAVPSTGDGGLRLGQLARAAGGTVAATAEAATARLRNLARRVGLKVPNPPPRQPLPAASVPQAPAAAPARRVRPRTPATPAPTAAAASAATPVAPPDLTIYTAADTDVTPPRAIGSHQPAAPAGGARPDELPEVELVVSPAGEVESVRLVTPQAGVRPAMMLSAIKSWRFDPATRKGQPVRYRLLMRLTNQ